LFTNAKVKEHSVQDVYFSDHRALKVRIGIDRFYRKPRASRNEKIHKSLRQIRVELKQKLSSIKIYDSDWPRVALVEAAGIETRIPK
jgi:predicted alpha-1,6-mannanase (GH76 family)